VSHEFSLVLSRKITDDEAETLIAAGPGGAALGAASLPTDPEVTVTRLDFDTESPTLGEAIREALEALKKVSDLTAASLEVPAQPRGGPGGAEGSQDEPGAAVAEVISDTHHAPAVGEAPPSAEEGVGAPMAYGGQVRKTSQRRKTNQRRKKAADSASVEASD
jgi:hypothetical protein